MTPAPPRSGLPRASLYAVGLAWLIPFLQPYHRYPITAFYNEWIALALGLAAALLLLRADTWRTAEVPAVAFAPLGLVLLLGLHVALDRVTYPEEALMAALYLLWTVLLVMLGWVLRRELGLAAVADVLAGFLAAGGLLNAVAALLQLYDAAGPLSFLVADRAGPAIYGNLRQQNHFATYVAIGTASTGYLFARGRLSGLCATPCMLLFMLVLGVSSSRSTWLYLGTFALLAVVCHRVRRDAASRRLAGYSLSLLPAFALAQWAATLPLLQPAVMVTSLERLFELATGIEPRLELARQAWGMFLGAPWIGIGWGQFAWHRFLDLASTGPGILPGISNHAHNIVLHLLAETGIAGAGLLAGAAALWIADARHARFDLEWWWLLALVAVLAIHSLLEYPLWYAYFLGVAALLAGLGSRCAVSVRRAGLVRALVVLFVLSGAIHLAAVLGPYREFERLIFDPGRPAVVSMTDGEFTEAITRLRREPVVAPYVELVVALSMEATPERLREKLELNTRAMYFRPSYHVTLHQAMLLALAGDRAAAARQLDLVLRAYPDQLDDAVRVLGGLAGRHPVEATPLLELAAARKAELRGSGALGDDARRR